MIIGLILIAVGVIALLVKLDVLSGPIWSYTWPAILIILGLSFLLGRLWRRRPWHWFGCCPMWGDRDKNRKE